MHIEQKELIHKTSWKYLIILDACRYDYFKKCYKKFFDDSFVLMKVYSPASWTLDWLKNTWTKKYNDIIYISANPFVSDKVTVKGFCGGDHFVYVVKVWKEYWDDRLGTVHPKDMTEISIEYIRNYPEYRFVLHYLQPHSPFIEFKDVKNMLKSKRTFLSYVKRLLPLNTRKKLSIIIQKYFGPKLYGFLFRMLNGPKSYHEIIAKYYGIDCVRKYYMKNLALVLKYITKLEKEVGDIVVTSDHGELLGEYGKFSHPWKVYDKEIQLAVPWLYKKDYV